RSGTLYSSRNSMITVSLPSGSFVSPERQNTKATPRRRTRAGSATGTRSNQPITAMIGAMALRIEDGPCDRSINPPGAGAGDNGQPVSRSRFSTERPTGVPRPSDVRNNHEDWRLPPAILSQVPFGMYTKSVVTRSFVDVPAQECPLAQSFLPAFATPKHFS